MSWCTIQLFLSVCEKKQNENDISFYNLIVNICIQIIVFSFYFCKQIIVFFYLSTFAVKKESVTFIQYQIYAEIIH